MANLSFSCYNYELDSDRTTIIGRNVDHDKDIIVYGMCVSRKHASVFRVGDQWFIQDLGSLNGTTLNDVYLESHKPYELKNGDSLLIAKAFRLEFRS